MSSSDSNAKRKQTEDGGDDDDTNQPKKVKVEENNEEDTNDCNDETDDFIDNQNNDKEREDDPQLTPFQLGFIHGQLLSQFLRMRRNEDEDEGEDEESFEDDDEETETDEDARTISVVSGFVRSVYEFLVGDLDDDSEDPNVQGKEVKENNDEQVDSNDDETPTKKEKPKRCHLQDCSTKLNLTSYSCRCGKFFCSLHTPAEEHQCDFDYKEMGRNKIKGDNPKCVKEKINKI